MALVELIGSTKRSQPQASIEVWLMLISTYLPPFSSYINLLVYCITQQGYHPYFSPNRGLTVFPGSFEDILPQQNTSRLKFYLSLA